MNEERETRRLGRRAFLRGMGFATGAAGAAVVALSGRKARAAVAPSPGKSRAGYRETEHVRRYYELSRE